MKARPSSLTASALALIAAVSLVATSAPAASMDAARADHSDTIGADGHQWRGAERCRGAKFRALQDALISGFDISLKNTAGSKLQFRAYEAFDDSEAYEAVPSATVEKMGTIGDSFGWESAEGFYLKVSAQKFYVLLACWDDAQPSYRGAAKIAPQDISFGEYVGGAYFDGGSEPPHSFRPATATHDYLVRVHSTDTGPRGNIIPFHDTDPFLSDPTRGRPGVEIDNDNREGPETGPASPPGIGAEPAPELKQGACTIVAPACGEL